MSDAFYEAYLKTKNGAVQTLNAVKGLKKPEAATIKRAAMGAVRAELECVAYQMNTGDDMSLHEDALINLISLISCAADLLDDEQKKKYWELLSRTSNEVLTSESDAPAPRPETGESVRIPVAQLEFREGQNTIWVHSPRGATVLRIQTAPGKKIRSKPCKTNICSHADISVPNDVEICLSNDAEVE